MLVIERLPSFNAELAVVVVESVSVASCEIVVELVVVCDVKELSTVVLSRLPDEEELD